MDSIKKTTARLYRNEVFVGSGLIYKSLDTAYVVTAGHILYGTTFRNDPILTEWVIEDPMGIKHLISEIQCDVGFAQENDIVQLKLVPIGNIRHLICPIFIDVPVNANQEFLLRGQYSRIDGPVNKGPIRFDERLATHPYKFLCNIPKEQLQNSYFEFGSEWLQGCSGSGLFLTGRLDCFCAGILLKIPDRGDNGKLLFCGFKALKEIGFGPKILDAAVFEPNPDDLTSDWFKSKLDNAIAALGKRYSPTINFQLSITKVFNGISRNKQFRGDLNAFFSNIFKARRSVFHADNVPEISTQFATADKMIESFKIDYLSTDLGGVAEIPFRKWTDQIADIERVCKECRSILYNRQRSSEALEPRTSYSSRPCETELYEMRNYISALGEFSSYINSFHCKIANEPCVILKGDAGFGKSHLLADIARHREEQGHRTIMLLGHQFQTMQNPWQQITSRLMHTGNEQKFLGELNARGAIDGHRVLVIIDAINEGTGKQIWHDHIVEFILEAKKFPWVSLVLSVRTTYEPLLIPDQVRSESLAHFVTHHGFMELEEEATDYFFENYGINKPGIPLLHPEFGSPLFLKLFCEGLQRKQLHSVPPGFEGLTMILDLFLGGINEKLAEKFGYNSRQTYVQTFVEALAESIANSERKYVIHEEAVNLSVNTIKLLELSQRPKFWDALIEEGVVSQEFFWTGNSASEEGYIIVYERFHEHLLVSNLLKKIRNPFKAAQQTELLNQYIGSDDIIRNNAGIIEALSIQLPEKYGIELFDVCKPMRASQTIAEAFIKSIVWRTNASYGVFGRKTRSENIWSWLRRKWLDYREGNRRKRIDDYLVEVIGTSNHLESLLLQQLILLSGNKGNPFNADYLHSQFISMSLAHRDTTFLPWLARDFSRGETVKRLIRWSWKEQPKSHLDNESVLLSCTTLSWMLISSNRQLRDEATKGIICLLFQREGLIQPLIEKFECVNDPYIYERLLAVAYGCTLRANSNSFLRPLCDYLLNVFFSKAYVYPHILARDYARGICEFARHSRVITEDQYILAQPPYRSLMPTDIVSNENITRSFAWKENDQNTYYLSEILNSMNVTKYGDFGNYVFERNLKFWDVDPQEMKRFALSLILIYGYDAEQYGPAEREIADLQENSERIGKKYQYIAMHETLAIVADNCAVNKEDYDAEKAETYKGAWQKGIRDIDVSSVIPKTLETTDDPRLSNPWWVHCTLPDWTKNNTDWMLSKGDLPNPVTVLEVKDKKETTWINLQTYFSWQEETKPGYDRYGTPHKRMFMYYRPYLVHKNEVLKFRKYCKTIKPRHNDLPDSRNYHTVLSREFYWSEAYTDQQQEYFGGNGDKEIFDWKSHLFVTAVHIPVEEIMWAESLDKSKVSTIGYFRLSKRVWDSLGLRFGFKEGIYVDQHNRIMCQDPSVYEAGPGALLINKEILSNYLMKNDLVLTWYIEGAKQILSAQHTGAIHDPRVEHQITGFACFDGHTVFAHQKSHIHRY